MNTLNAIHVYSYCVYCAQSELETMRNQYLNDMRTFMERMISQRPENAPVAGRNETGSLNSSTHPALALLPFFLFLLFCTTAFTFFTFHLSITVRISLEYTALYKKAEHCLQ